VATKLTGRQTGGAARWFYEMADGSLTIGYTRFGMIADRHLQRR